MEKASARNGSDQRSPLHERLVDLFLGARSSIQVVSPYFVRGKDGLERIRHLVARGVRVEVLTNSLATTDELLAHVVYARYRHSLLEAGMNLRELAAVPGRDPASAFHAYRLHAKRSVIDENWLYVGSLNFTKRSEHLNTEMGLILECPLLARDVLDLLQSVPSYDLRLARNPVGLEWVYKSSEPERVLQSDPGASAWRKFRSAIVDPFVPEEEI